MQHRNSINVIKTTTNSLAGPRILNLKWKRLFGCQPVNRTDFAALFKVCIILRVHHRHHIRFASPIKCFGSGFALMALKLPIFNQRFAIKLIITLSNIVDLAHNTAICTRMGYLKPIV